MRDSLCNEEACKEGIEYHKDFITKRKESIESLKEDEKNGVQRYPNDNKSIIESRYLRIFTYQIEDIRAKYSLGDDIREIEGDFHSAIDHLEHTGTREIGYVFMLWVVSLGILLETDKRNLERIGKIVEEKEVNDALIDYLLCASDIGWAKMTNAYCEESPYAKTREIIELAEIDQGAASERLQTYMEKEWLTGHRGYGWKNAHKDPGYVGFWSFETAALAKILKLDDASLIHHNRYPYDLAHYKNEMVFKPVVFGEPVIEEEIEVGPEGIGNNPSLEKIIPIRWHAFIDVFIQDYQDLDAHSFYEKYKETVGLDQIWFSFDDYVKENEQNNLLGTLIVFALTKKGYILQIDYKEDLADYESFLKNYWKHKEIKMIQFMLDNDQNYYALVPVDSDVSRMYEVIIKDVE